MRQIKLSALTIVQLVQQFAALALQQDMALLSLEQHEVNRLVWKLDAINQELKSRPGDQRSALLSLYGHKNKHVWLKAAQATLAVAPQAARAQLEAIRESGWQPQAGHAGMCLWSLDQGIYKPR